MQIALLLMEGNGTEQKIKNNITYMIQSFENKDIKGIMKYYPMNSHIFLVGTGKIELITGFEAIKKLWEESFYLDEIKVNNLKFHNIEITENVAWCVLSLELILRDKDVVITDFVRISNIWEKMDDEWFVKQWHASFPQIGDEEGTGWPTALGIEKKIIELINEFDLNSKFFDNAKARALKNYLEKAREIASELQ